MRLPRDLPIDKNTESLELHRRLRGKIEICSKMSVDSARDLAAVYTPGVAAACEAIASDPREARNLTLKGNAVAVVSDGSAVLGLGAIGPYAALPVMEGKAMLFKQLAGIDAWPICLDAKEAGQIVTAVRQIAPVFGAVNLEDIAAPRCFEVESRLQDLGIPVMHDDQHGTAIVVLAAMINAARVLRRRLSDLRVVVNGAGAAGLAIARLLRCADEGPPDCLAVRDVVVCDSRGAIHSGRRDLSSYKRDSLGHTNREDHSGELRDVLRGADVFIGASRGNLLAAEDIATMREPAVVMALANPTPEIMPHEAQRGGAAVVATGRSDFPNQVNNVLVFPGVFRGALDANASRITNAMKTAAARALAECVVEPSPTAILPEPLDRGTVPLVAEAVRAAAAEDEAAMGAE